MTTYPGWSPISVADLNGDGSDLLRALAGRIQRDDPDLVQLLVR